MLNISIIYEDDYLLVVNKPAGLLVHPTERGETNTLTSWFLGKCPNTKDLAWPDPTRAGIAHRLDKETSGLIILAKNPEILAKLQDEFREHTIKKTYQALVWGKTPEEGKIEAAIVRHPQKDMQTVQEMTFSFTKGTVRPSITNFKTINRYRFKKEDLSLVEVYPETGRMHQIRVHFKHLGFPLIGDPLYFNKPSRRLSKELGLVDRQFLHAVKLEFTHPETGESLSFSSPLAEDLLIVLNKLRLA